MLSMTTVIFPIAIWLMGIRNVYKFSRVHLTEIGIEPLVVNLILET